MARIQILGQNGDYIELGEKIEIPLNFSIADIKDVEKRKSSFSKTIIVPGTDNNNNILNHYYNVNIENGDFINNIVKCTLVGDSGEILFNNGVIQLLRVIKRNVVATGEDKVNYEILLKDDVGDLYTNMSNKKLEDLFMQDLNHRYDLATVTASLYHTSADGYKYILPWIQPQGLPTDNQYKLTELKPGIYAKRYLDSIFQSNGYTYTWAESNSNDIQFDKLIVPYNGDVPKLDEQDVQQFRVVAETSTATQSVLGASFDTDARISTFLFPDGIGRTQIVLDDEIEDIQSLYDPILGEYVPNYDAQSPGGIDYQFEIDYDIIATNTHGTNVQLKPKNLTSVPVGTDIITMEVISTVKNNTQNINYDYYFDSFNLERDYTLAPGDNVIHSSSKTFTQIAPNINSFNQLINGISLKVSHIFAGQTTKEGKWYIPAGSGTDVSIAYQVRVNTIRMIITPSVNNAASYGAIINMNKFIPKNIQQKDFLKSLSMMFNLFIIPDENNPRNLIIKNKDTYYSEGNTTDWTDYLVKDLPQQIDFLSDLNAKRLTLTYKQDNDVPNKGYFDSTGEIYGQSEFVFDNQYTKGDDKKEIIFSPTPNANTSFDANLPIITGAAPKTNIRILYDGGLLPCGDYRIIDTGSISSTFSTYPYNGHFDKPIDSNYDLNFSTPDYLFYDDFNTITQNNLFNKFWRTTFSQINNSKVLTAYFTLDDSIISNFRMNDKIYLRQYESYWVVNQIYDYIVGGKTPTKVELVQLQDLGVRPIVNEYNRPSNVEFPDPSIRFRNLNSAPNRSDINIYGFDNYVTNNSTKIDIIGSNNNVGGSNIQVYGDNNIGYWDNTIINISNLIVNEPNSVNNIVFPSGFQESLEETLAIGNTTGTYSIILDNTYVSGGVDPVTASAANILYLGATGGDEWMIGDRDLNAAFLRYNLSGNLQLSNGNGDIKISTADSSGDINIEAGTQIVSTVDDTTTNEISTITQTPQSIAQIVDLDGTTNNFSQVSNSHNNIFTRVRDTSTGYADILQQTQLIKSDVVDSNTNEASAVIQTPQVIGQVVDLDGTNTEYASNSINYVSIDSTVTDSTTYNSNVYQEKNSIVDTVYDIVNDISYISKTGQLPFGQYGVQHSIELPIVLSEPITLHRLTPNSIESSIRISSSMLGTRIAQNTNTITLETRNVIGVLGSMNIQPTFRVYNEHNVLKNKQNVVTTTDATVTNLTTYSPLLAIPGVFTVEFDVYGFESATGNAIGAKALAVFKVVGGVVIQVDGTTLDRKSNFPGSVTVIVDTDGTVVRFRVKGQAGRTIDWKGGYVVNI